MKKARRVLSALLILIIFGMSSVFLTAYAETIGIDDITSKIDALKPIMQNKYWNGNKSEKDLKHAVNNGDIDAASLGITANGCKASYRADGCTSNSFGGGSQCNGFSKFIAYYLFGENGYVGNWNNYEGNNIAALSLQPGDRIGTNGHHAIVWKVSDGIVYVIECWGTYSSSHDGCKINFGYFNGSSKYKSEVDLKNMLMCTAGGYVQRNPNISSVISNAYGASSNSIPVTSIEKMMRVNVGNGYTLRVCSTWNSSKAYAIGSLNNGSIVFVTGVSKEKHDDRYWARIDFNGAVGWVNTDWLEDISPVEPQAKQLAQKPIISISGNNAPGTLEVGSNFGIRGTVSTDYGVLTEVYGAILDSSGNAVQTSRYYPNSSTNDLRYSINNDLIFNYLPVGNYTYYVAATAENSDQITTTTVISSGFSVYSNQTPQITSQPTPIPTQQVFYDTPTIYVSDNNSPGSLTQGSNFGIRGTVYTNCGLITELYGAIYDSNGNAIQTSWYTPNASSVDLRYTVNNDLIFNYLTAGEYTYHVKATAVNGDKTTSKVVISENFNIYSPQPAVAAAPQADSQISVIYDANGGQNAPSTQYYDVYNHEVTIVHPASIPTRPGYGFLGWRLENDSAYKIDSPEESCAFGGMYDNYPLTYYAQWIEIY